MASRTIFVDCATEEDEELVSAAAFAAGHSASDGAPVPSCSTPSASRVDTVRWKWRRVGIATNTRMEQLQQQQIAAGASEKSQPRHRLCSEVSLPSSVPELGRHQRRGSDCGEVAQRLR